MGPTLAQGGGALFHMRGPLGRTLSRGRFANHKETFLAKRDKSGKGEWDESILRTCSLLNALPWCFSTSSCGGRAYFWTGTDVPGKRKTEPRMERLRETHVPPDGEFFALPEAPAALWLRFEPFILHVRMATWADGQRLARAARPAAPNTHVMVGAQKLTVTIPGVDSLELPYRWNGRPASIPDDDLLSILQTKFVRNSKRIEDLEKSLAQLS